MNGLGTLKQFFSKQLKKKTQQNSSVNELLKLFIFFSTIKPVRL